MKPGEPWIEVPDEWLDDMYSGHEGYRAFQEYFDLKIKPEVINEYLIGQGILPDVEIKVGRFAAQEINGKLGIDATLNLSGVTRLGKRGTDLIEIYRTINGPGKECRFDKIGAGTVNLSGFGVEYYRRVIPFLDKLGIRKITMSPTTAPEESPERFQFNGAYVWSFYGYTNDNMNGTLKQYIDYLRNVKKISLSKTEEDDILDIKRMVRLANDGRCGEFTGKKFLSGLDGNDKPTRALWWDGTQKNINDRSDSNIEMRELAAHIVRRIK